MIDVAEAYGLTFHVPANDIGIGQMLRDRGEFARVESDLITDYMRAAGSGTYIDVGGNVGAIALPVAASVPQCDVIAVEAQGLLADLLAQNAEQNGLTNVSVIHAAAGASAGEIEFPQPDPALSVRLMYGAVGLKTEGFRSQRVAVRTLDEIAPSDTRFVKIDVEGSELEVLRGAQHLIENVRPCWLIEANDKSRQLVHQCMDRLRSRNYDLFWFHAPFDTPRDGQPQSLQGDLNFLAVPSESDMNLWGLHQIVGQPSIMATTKAQCAYLKRYGFSWRD